MIGGFLTRGELHHPAPCLIGRMPNRPDAKDLADARQFATAVIEHISAGRPEPVAGSRPDAFRPRWGFQDLVALLSSDGLLRWVLPESKLNPSRCDRCQWCVHACPMHNITLQTNPVLGHQCIRCYRCVSGCPRRAFDTDWRLGNLVILSF